MQVLMLATIVVTGLTEYLASLKWLPDQVKYLQELCALGAVAYVVVVGISQNFANVRAIYWWLFGALAVIMVCGIVANTVEPGPVFAGLRTYLRAVPFFFLPAVYLFSERQIRTQLKWLLLLALVQLPIALEQRFTSFEREYYSGDRTVGTLMDSGMLSIFLIAVASVLTGLFLRRRIALIWYVPLLLVVLAPTMINETKATLVLVPIALLTTFIIGSRRGTRMKNTALALALLVGFGALFLPVYDYFMKPRWGYGLAEFVTREGRLEGYLAKGGGIGASEAGRVDSLVVPLRDLSRDPATLAFGLGVGNASDSALGQQFVGQYQGRYEVFMTSAATRSMLEVGVLGFGVFLILLWVIFADSLRVARLDAGLHGAIALGWAGTVGAMGLAMLYTDFIPFGIITFMFWYFSGLIAAHRVRLATGAVDADA